MRLADNTASHSPCSVTAAMTTETPGLEEGLIDLLAIIKHHEGYQTDCNVKTLRQTLAPTPPRNRFLATSTAHRQLQAQLQAASILRMSMFSKHTSNSDKFDTKHSLLRHRSKEANAQIVHRSKELGVQYGRQEQDVRVHCLWTMSMQACRDWPLTSRHSHNRR